MDDYIKVNKHPSSHNHPTLKQEESKGGVSPAEARKNSSQAKKVSMMNVAKLKSDVDSSELEDEVDSELGQEREMKIEDIINPAESPGLKQNIANFDIPLRR